MQFMIVVVLEDGHHTRPSVAPGIFYSHGRSLSSKPRYTSPQLKSIPMVMDCDNGSPPVPSTHVSDRHEGCPDGLSRYSTLAGKEPVVKRRETSVGLYTVYVNLICASGNSELQAWCYEVEERLARYKSSHAESSQRTQRQHLSFAGEEILLL